MLLPYICNVTACSEPHSEPILLPNQDFSEPLDQGLELHVSVSFVSIVVSRRAAVQEARSQLSPVGFVCSLRPLFLVLYLEEFRRKLEFSTCCQAYRVCEILLILDALSWVVKLAKSWFLGMKVRPWGEFVSWVLTSGIICLFIPSYR